MAEFIRENGMIILTVVIFAGFTVSFILKAVKTAKLSKKISREGREAAAVVSRIVADNDPDSNSSREVYVTFKDEIGREHEAILGTVREYSLKKGDEVRILYLPGVYDTVKESM